MPTNCQWTVVTNDAFLSECFLMWHLLWWKRSWNYHESLIFDKILNLEMPECSKTYKPYITFQLSGASPHPQQWHRTHSTPQPSSFTSFFLSFLMFSLYVVHQFRCLVCDPLKSLFLFNHFPLYTPHLFSRSTWLAVIFQIPPWQLPCLNQSELTSFWLICTFCDWFSSLGIIWCSVPSLPEQIKL